MGVLGWVAGARKCEAFMPAGEEDLWSVTLSEGSLVTLR